MNEKENGALHITNNEGLEKESNNCDWKEIEDSDAKKHLEKEQKNYCDFCLQRSSSQNELYKHVNQRHNKEQL